jgi:hypothetical protein
MLPLRHGAGRGEHHADAGRAGGDAHGRLRDDLVQYPVAFTGCKLLYHNDAKSGDPILTPLEVPRPSAPPLRAAASPSSTLATLVLRAPPAARSTSGFCRGRAPGGTEDGMSASGYIP